ncbi:hypothetical protein OBV_25090 [Oscillibacter valericigenes Sjm18-20]|nr:hypothetical protein OBV_25090 [Oscillibacter valericigenes Sjm18-20]
MNEKNQTMEEILREAGVTMPEGDMFLSEPFKLDGEAAEKLHYNFSTITGRDAMRITAKLKQDGLLGGGDQQNDSNYQAAVFAAACGMELADLYRLPIADVNQAGKYAQLFFALRASQISAREKSEKSAS